MPTPLTKEVLDRMVCQVPGCAHDTHDGRLFLHGRCHISKGVDVCYTVGSGVLRIACVQCKKLVAEVAVQGLVGATGETPTSDTPGDKGGLRAVISIQGDRIHMNFGKSLSWVEMTMVEASALATELDKKVGSMLAGGK